MRAFVFVQVVVAAPDFFVVDLEALCLFEVLTVVVRVKKKMIGTCDPCLNLK